MPLGLEVQARYNAGAGARASVVSYWGERNPSRHVSVREIGIAKSGWPIKREPALLKFFSSLFFRYHIPTRVWLYTDRALAFRICWGEHYGQKGCSSQVCWKTNITGVLLLTCDINTNLVLVAAFFLFCTIDSRLHRALELAQALEYMHGGCGIGVMMHRDIKNVSAQLLNKFDYVFLSTGSWSTALAAPSPQTRDVVEDH